MAGVIVGSSGGFCRKYTTGSRSTEKSHQGGERTKCSPPFFYGVGEDIQEKGLYN